ncbi:hypothetical protein MMC2321_01103 [Chitinophaga sp. MM2321]
MTDCLIEMIFITVMKIKNTDLLICNKINYSTNVGHYFDFNHI